MNEIRASIAGIVAQLLVGVGEPVTEDQVVVLLESMKMEIPQMAETQGTVKGIHVSAGDFVNEGDLLITLE